MKAIIVSLALFVFMLVALVIYLSDTSRNGGDLVLGNWETSHREELVHVYKEGGKYSAKYISTERAPDRIFVFHDMEYSAAKKRWEKGTFYDPETGDAMNGYIIAAGHGTLKITSSVSPDRAGREEIWTRKEDLP